MIHERTCPECGATFEPLHGSQVCCSDECKRSRIRWRKIEIWHKTHGGQPRAARAPRKQKLSPRQKMKINLARRDALCPKPKTEIIERNGIVIERRGTVPAGANAAGLIRHNA